MVPTKAKKFANHARRLAPATTAMSSVSTAILVKSWKHIMVVSVRVVSVHLNLRQQKIA